MGDFQFKVFWVVGRGLGSRVEGFWEDGENGVTGIWKVWDLRDLWFGEASLGFRVD